MGLGAGWRAQLCDGDCGAKLLLVVVLFVAGLLCLEEYLRMLHRQIFARASVDPRLCRLCGRLRVCACFVGTLGSLLLAVL